MGSLWYVSLIIPMKFDVLLLAYIDPGSGSMLLQMLLGGVAGVAVAVRMYWHRLRAFFGARSKDTPDA